MYKDGLNCLIITTIIIIIIIISFSADCSRDDLLCYIHQNFTIFEFYISHGSVATYVRFGGKRDRGFIANSITNLIVKELRKSATFAKVMLKTRVASLFDSHCGIRHKSTESVELFVRTSDYGNIKTVTSC